MRAGSNALHHASYVIRRGLIDWCKSPSFLELPTFDFFFFDPIDPAVLQSMRCRIVSGQRIKQILLGENFIYNVNAQFRSIAKPLNFAPNPRVPNFLKTHFIYLVRYGTLLLG